jgi:Mg/Co/Ni transporter MgtE
MAALKHVGKIRKTGAKVVVVFRTLPDDPHHALVLGVNSLSDMYHNSMMQLLEDGQGQQANEFGEAMSTRFFPDGRQMLTAMHGEGRLQKIATVDIDMTPTTTSVISLDKLNELIAEQQGVKLADLAKDKPKTPAPKETSKAEKIAAKQAVAAPVVASNGPLTDEDLARQLRSQADAMFKEAQTLRKQADDLAPPVKKTVKKKEAASA